MARISKITDVVIPPVSHLVSKWQANAVSPHVFYARAPPLQAGAIDEENQGMESARRLVPGEIPEPRSEVPKAL